MVAKKPKNKLIYCNIKSCLNNLNWRCQADKLRLVDIDSKQFDDDIEHITISPILDYPQVEKAMVVCMTYKEKPAKPAIRRTFEITP